MKTRHKIGYGIFAVMFALAFAALSMAGCGDGGGGGGGSTLGGNITIKMNGIPVTTAFVGNFLFAVYDGFESVSYQWKRDGENVGTDDTSSYEYEIDQEGSYTVTVSAAGYQSKTSAPVIVAGLPELSGNVLISPFSNANAVTVHLGTQLTAAYSGDDVPIGGNMAIDTQFQWKRGETIVHTQDSYSTHPSSSYTPDEEGTYTVTFTARERGYKISDPVTLVTLDPSVVYGTWAITQPPSGYTESTLTVSADTVRFENGSQYLQYSDVTWTGMFGYQTGSTSYLFNGTRTSNMSNAPSFSSISLAADGQLVGITVNYLNDNTYFPYSSSYSFTKQP